MMTLIYITLLYCIFVYVIGNNNQNVYYNFTIILADTFN